MRERWNRLRALLALGLASGLLPAARAAAEVTTVAGLKEEGVSIRRIELQALTASVEIDVAVDPDRTPGRYAGAECVVLKEPVAADRLVAADAAVTGGGAVARRARSQKPTAELLVLGREIPRAYLAIEFSVPRDGARPETLRFLLPVSAIDGSPAGSGS